MHLDVVEVLRCPAAHAESHLVASIDRLEGRYIAEGSLGCPVCETRYPIRDFVARFDKPAVPDPAADTTDPLVPRIGEGEITRAAALLDARTPGVLFVLEGTWGWMASAIAIGFDVHCLVVDPPRGVAPGDGVSMIRVADRLPIAADAAAGAALDDVPPLVPARLAAVVRAVRPGGRVVGPTTLAVPDGVRELARDRRHWVAERTGSAAPPVPLRLGRRA